MEKQLIGQDLTCAERLSGQIAGLSGHLPQFLQRILANQFFGFNNEYPSLDPHLQMVIAARNQKSISKLFEGDPLDVRFKVRKEIAILTPQKTPVAAVDNLTIPSRSGELSVRFYTPRLERPAQQLPLLIFFHGGGFLFGDLETADEPCRLLCQTAQIKVLSVDYRLSPEHPAPAAIEDSLDALQWAHAHAADYGIDPAKIGVGGDSAGGNLAAVISQLAIGKSYAPAAQLLLYPSVDFHNDYASYATYGERLLLLRTDIDVVRKVYLGNSPLTTLDPLVSPLFGTFSGLAPALIVAAGLDILRDHGEAYALKMRDAGATCVTYCIEGQPHAFFNLTGVNKAAYRAAIKVVHDFRALLDEK